jgi:hypothetical protein
VNDTLFSPDCTFSTRVPVWMLMFCLARERAATFDTSASSSGSTRSSASSRMTFVPSLP